MHQTGIKILALLLTCFLHIILVVSSTNAGNFLLLTICFLITLLTGLALITTPQWKTTVYSAIGWGMFTGTMITLVLGILSLLFLHQLAPLSN